MENKKKYYLYYLLILLLVLAASAYPLYMGIKVLGVMAREGAVPVEEYPKYIIPYTPIAVAVIIGTLLFPLIQKLSKKLDLLWATVIGTTVFFAAERYLETKVLVQTVVEVPLEGWQMALCYIPPKEYETRTWEAVDVLLGGYSPAFKLHFYLISVVIIVALLNIIYGFAKIIRTGENKRRKALAMQTFTALAFLGMCIWACFTSFYRTGEITVSPLSSVLMAVFFALLGVTMGIFAGSLTLGKKRFLSVAVPTVTAVVATVAMYIGEMILLSGNLYRFGEGFFFEPLGVLVLAPIDIVIVIAAGAITGIICLILNRKEL
jgi:lysylphosphatidylglycerol synthetase-like protein (DUF2156 family)